MNKSNIDSEVTQSVLAIIGQNLNRYSFDPLYYQDEYQLKADIAKQTALKVRNLTKSILIKQGYTCIGTSLTGQLRKYKSFGIDDGRTRTVYYLSIK